MLTTSNIFEEYPNIVTTVQLQEMLGIGRTAVLNLLKNGEIKSVKIGNAYKVPKAYVIDYLNTHTNGKEE